MINVDPKFALWPTNRDINIYVICWSKGPHRESLPEVLSRYLGPRAELFLKERHRPAREFKIDEEGGMKKLSRENNKNMEEKNKK